MLDGSPHAAEADPRTPELRPRRPDPGALIAALDRDPVLVVPTLDDVYSFERELCASGAVLGAAVMTFGGLFRTVATAGGAPPGRRPDPGPAARRRRRRGRGAARRPRPAAPLGRAAGLSPRARAPARRAAGRGPRARRRRSGGRDARGLRLPRRRRRAVRRLRRGPRRPRLLDTHGDRPRGDRAARRAAASWWRRPVFLYGFDDLTRNQLDLIARARGGDRGDGRAPLRGRERGARQRARAAARGPARRSASTRDARPPPTRQHPDAPLLFHLERGFGRDRAAPPAARREPRPPALRRRARRGGGDRGRGRRACSPPAPTRSEIAIVVRDPARRGPLFASVLESYGIAGRARGRGPGRRRPRSAAPDRASRGDPRQRPGRRPAALPARTVGRLARRGSTGSSARSAASASQTAAGPSSSGRSATRSRRADVARSARGGRPARPTLAGRGRAPSPRRWAPAPERELEARAGGGDRHARLPSGPSSTAWRRRPAALAPRSRHLDVRVWSGPVEGRVRIADPYRVRAARFDHVFVASLQDGEFPRRDGRRRPVPLRAPARVASACSRVATPRPRSATSSTPAWRCPAGASSSPTATATRTAPPRRRSPLLDEVRRLLEPGDEDRSRGEAASSPRSSTGSPTRPRRPSWRGRSPPSGGGADAERAARRSPAAEAEAAGRIAARLDARPRAPRPPAGRPGRSPTRRCSTSLAAVPAYGGTTLEGFDVCSYRWFVSHELAPAAARPGPRPARPGRHRARGPRAPLRGAARRRPPPPARLARRLDRARPRAGRARSRAERRARRAPGRAGDAAPGRGLAGPLPRRGVAPRARRLRALAAGGRLLRGRGGRAAARSRSTAGACTGRSTGSTAPPTAAPSSSTTSSPPRSPRATSSRRRRSCSCSST